MLFGFRFLKQVLFGENTTPLRKEAADKLQERVQQRTQQMEQEAREKRAAEADDMYGVAWE